MPPENKLVSNGLAKAHSNIDLAALSSSLLTKLADYPALTWLPDLVQDRRALQIKDGRLAHQTGRSGGGGKRDHIRRGVQYPIY
jgi:hypothetical protein